MHIYSLKYVLNSCNKIPCSGLKELLLQFVHFYIHIWTSSKGPKNWKSMKLEFPGKMHIIAICPKHIKSFSKCCAVVHFQKKIIPQHINTKKDNNKKAKKNKKLRNQDWRIDWRTGQIQCIQCNLLYGV